MDSERRASDPVICPIRQPRSEPQPDGAGHPSDGARVQHRADWLAARRALEAQPLHSTPGGLRRVLEIPDWFKSTIGLGLRAMGMWRRGIANGLDLRLRPLELQASGLPEVFDGYRILHLTDPHFDAADGLAQAIVERVRGLEVDLCALTGDFRRRDRGAFTELGILEPLGALREQVKARDGFVATLGNHDGHDMVEPLERLGYRVLLNESTRIHRAGHRIAITGVDDVHRFYTPAARAVLERRDVDFAILLAHSPELAGEAAAAGYGLYLCGHCHGGQLCLPGGRAVVRRLVRHRAYYRGLWRCGDLIGYTSPGAGLSGLPVRYNCPPEVTLITLRAT